MTETLWYPLSRWLTPTLAGSEITHPSGWSLWRLFTFNLLYNDLFLNFSPKMTLNKLYKNSFVKFAYKIFNYIWKNKIIKKNWNRSVRTFCFRQGIVFRNFCFNKRFKNKIKINNEKNNFSKRPTACVKVHKNLVIFLIIENFNFGEIYDRIFLIISKNWFFTSSGTTIKIWVSVRL